jgi:MFS transporter, DHA1 family, multidrug resistance protein
MDSAECTFMKANNPEYITRHKNFIIFILGILATIDPFSIDFYLPAFSQIAHDFHTTTAKVSLSISSYFIGLAIGQVFYGPITDRFGRKRPLFIGLCFYVLTCVGCMLTDNVESLVVCRFFHALSGAVAAVCAFAMVRDFFPVGESARIFSSLMLIIGISPLAAPSLGGLIADWVGWQGEFVVLGTIAVLIMLLCKFYLPDGAGPDASVSLKAKPIILTFWSILKTPQFITYAVAGSFAFATLFIYLAGSPVIFMDMYHLSAKQFGLIFTLLSCLFIGSNKLNVLLLKRFTSEAIFGTCLVCLIAADALFLTGALLKWYGLVGTIVMFMLPLMCLGLMNPNAAALALAPFNTNLGSASSLLGCLQIGIAALASGFIGLFNPRNIIPIPVEMLATGVLALGTLVAGRKVMGKAFVELKAD